MSADPTFEITALPALNDNYIWAIHQGSHTIVVDPGEAAPVLAFLKTNNLQLEAILCTHRHHDHVGGIAELREVYNVPVYGRHHPGNLHITHNLIEGEQLKFDSPAIAFDIIDVPGHLVDHVAFIGPKLVFSGDIIFGAGCGRNFEGTPAQLQHSMQRLAALPDNTLVYCSHEYTAPNLRFAMVCEPDNADIQQRSQTTRQLRAANQITVPTNIALEKATNPFLRCTQPEIIHTLQQRGLTDTSELGVFTALRLWKNYF